ncbi:ribonuclease domain-containing protein [Nocardia sp. NPDC004123]
MTVETIALRTLWGKAIAIASVALATVALLLSGGHTERVAQHSTVAGVEVHLVDSTIPQRAWTTLSLIDQGTWPPTDCPGTKGGTTWQNRGGQLPDGVDYLEWDVNCKQPGRSRDAERIVTGNDGSAWYTGDHYASFTRMR